MTTNQIVIMGFSFSAMLAFAGLALWLFQRQKRKHRRTRAASGPAPAPATPPVATSPTADATALLPPPDPSAPSEASATDDATAFVEPAFGSENIAAAQTEGTTVLPAAVPPPRPTANVDATTLLPAAADIEGATVLPAAADEPPTDRTTVLPAAADEPPTDRTTLLAPIIDPTPITSATATEDRTAMVAPYMPEPAVTPDPEQPAEQPAEQPTQQPGQHAQVPAPRLVATPRPPTFQPEPVEREDPSIAIAHHFGLAVAALAKVHADPDDQVAQREWDGHATVMANAPADALEQAIRPHLGDDDPRRRIAACLALLASKQWRPRERFADILDELSSEARSDALRVLASWSDDRGDAIARAGLAQASDDADRPRWLEVLEHRGQDPGPAAIDAAVASDDVDLQCLGVRLLARHRRDDASALAKIDSLLFSTNPALRMQAIETALAVGKQTSWLVCKQLARNPSFPNAAALAGQLGSQAEVAMIAAALSTPPTAAALLGLGLSGRRAGIERCLEHIDHPEPDVARAARVGFSHATGCRVDADDPAGRARAWWDERGSAIAATGRHVGGRPLTLDALVDTLRDADLEHRQAVARELTVRSHGALHLYCDALPDAWRRQLDALRGATTLDLEAGFPWAEASAP